MRAVLVREAAIENQDRHLVGPAEDVLYRLRNAHQIKQKGTQEGDRLAGNLEADAFADLELLESRSRGIGQLTD